jgi:hypothetical protein
MRRKIVMIRLLASLATGIAVGVATYKNSKQQFEEDRRLYEEYLEGVTDLIRSDMPLEERISFARMAMAVNFYVSGGDHEALSKLITFKYINCTMRLSGIAVLRAKELGFGELHEQKALDDARKEELYAALADDHAFLLRCAEYDTELVAYLVDYHDRKPEDQPVPAELMPTVAAATRIASICKFWQF